MKKMISGVLVVGVLFSGAATQVVSANSNVLDQRFFQFSDTKETKNSTVEKTENKKITVYIDGFSADWYGAPIVKNERVMVPLKMVTSHINASVKRDVKTDKITVAYKNKKVVFSSGQKVVYVNGKKKQLDIPVQTIKGTTYVSIDFIAEVIGAKVKWDAKEKAVDITIYEEITNKYYYANKEGALGKPLSEKQLENIFNNKSGPDLGREFVWNTVSKDYSNNGDIIQNTHRFGKYNIDGTLVYVSSFVEATYNVKQNSFSEIKYYISVGSVDVGEDGYRFSIDREGKLDKAKFNSTDELLKYSAYDAINDLGIIERISQE